MDHKANKEELGSFFPLFLVHSMAANTLFPIPLIPFMLLRFPEYYFSEKVAGYFVFHGLLAQKAKSPGG